jgi:hypothetical protein
MRKPSAEAKDRVSTYAADLRAIRLTIGTPTSP